MDDSEFKAINCMGFFAGEFAGTVGINEYKYCKPKYSSYFKNCKHVWISINNTSVNI